jgi:hypothetical protein
MKVDLFVSKLCDPAKFYLFLSFIGVVLYTINFIEKQPMYTLCGLGGQVLLMVIYTYILNWVCSMKHGVAVSWVLVFLPFIILSMMLLVVIQTMPKVEEEEDTVEGYGGKSMNYGSTY